MRLNNFWLIYKRRAFLLRVIEWAQKNKVRVQDLTIEQIKALRF